MPGTQTNVDINGGVFGGHVGFNWQFSNWVIGLEASAAWTDIKGSTTASLAFPGVAGLATETFNTKLNWQATATPRLGLVWNDWLFYAKGGLAAGGVDMSSIRVSGTGGSFAATQQRVGWTVGAGIEWAYARNWVFGIEWDFVDLGTQNFAGFGPETTGASRFFGEDVRLRYNEVLGRLSYKFDEIR
jgi:outer membrane immunogenic protein